MCNRDCNDNQFFVFDFNEQTIVTDAVAPVAFQVGRKGLAGGSGIVAVFEMFSDPFDDDRLNGPIKLFKLFLEIFC